MRYTKVFFQLLLALGILFSNVYRAQSEMLQMASQIVYLTGSPVLTGNSNSGFTFPLSSLKRLDFDGALNNFIVPEKYVFIINSISLTLNIHASYSSYGPPTPPSSVEFKIGNFYSESTSIYLFSSDTSSGYVYKAMAGGGGMVMSAQYWNSNLLNITFTPSYNDYSAFTGPSLQVKVSGYLALRM
jgi:hypothetical protein